jgi:hypothetical protein
MLNVIARPGDTFAAVRHLLEDNHEDRSSQRRHIRRAIAIYRALLAAAVVERLAEPDATGRVVRLVVDLQPDFALNQPLSPFALAAMELLDRASPTYALDALSIVESTLDDPRPVLAAQQFKARGEAVAQMKAEGLDYDERMALLEGVTHPRPLADLLDAAYEMYRRGHPWVADHEVRPKSVARDMFERALSFSEFVRLYGLARSEGLVLRYLADAYRAMRQTVPADARTEEVEDLTEWLGELVRQVDSSLLEEWESLRAGEDASDRVRDAVGAGRHHRADSGPPPVTSNRRAFRVLVRNAMFRRVELAALRRYDELGELDGETGWDARAWEAALEAYFIEHDELGTGPDARGPHYFLLDEHPVDPAGARLWRVRQVFADPAGDHDWGIGADVDLAASDETGEAVVRVTSVGAI